MFRLTSKILLALLWTIVAVVWFVMFIITALTWAFAAAATTGLVGCCICLTEVTHLYRRQND